MISSFSLNLSNISLYQNLIDKNMIRRLLIVMIIFIGSSIALNAQGLLNKKEKAELTEQIKRDYAKLQLSKQQKVMYHKITLNHARELKL